MRLNLWITCAAQFLTLAGMTAVLPLMPVYLKQIGVSDPDALRYWTGILGSAPFAVAVFATPLWGLLSDRVGKKPMVVRSVAGMAVTTVGIGLSSSPAALFACRSLQGAVSGVFPAAVGLVTAWTPKQQLSRALAYLQSARAGGALMGPLIGGLLADIFGIRAVCFGVGALCAGTAIACSLLLDESTAEVTVQARSATDATWRELLGNRTLSGMMMLLVLFQANIMCSWPTLALFVEQFGIGKHSLGATTGLVVFAAGLPNMLTATTWSRLSRRFGIQQMLVLSLILTGAANLLVPLAHRIGFVFLFRALAGLSMAGFIPLAFELMNETSPDSARGRTAGLGSTAMMLGNVIGPLTGGWLAVHLDLAATFWVPGLVLLSVGLALALRGRPQRLRHWAYAQSRATTPPPTDQSLGQ